MIKTYVIDTNVLIQAPYNSLNSFTIGIIFWQ